MRRTADTSSLTGLDDSASSLSRYTNASTNVPHTRTNSIDISDYRPAKRRRVVGLNMRFDRMIKSVNTMLPYRDSSPAPSRKRIQSSGTSSVSSHDIPKTPVDAYSNLHPVKLGKDFAVLKMKKSLHLPPEDSGGCPKPVAPPKEPRNPLPDWLAHTFCSLEAGHPLRGLLSPSRINTEPKSNTPPVEFLGVSNEEEVFAFSPFELDKQEGAPDADYRANNALNIERVSSVIPTERVLSISQLGAPADALPFSTPGRFASVRTSIGDGTFQKPLVSQQMASHTTDMMHPSPLPPLHLRLDDEIESPQTTGSFSNFVQYDDPPSDFQEHGAYINCIPQVPGVGDDTLNVYATPGPIFACPRPVYFVSPTEDPSLSDPLQPESYELDLNAIDFRWRPFLRSNLQERDSNRQSALPSSPLGHAIPNPAGDQSGWDASFVVDQGKYSASSDEVTRLSDEVPSLAEDMEVTYLCDAMQPSNLNATKSSAIANPDGRWSSLINDVLRPVSALASEDLLSPLPGSALLASDSVRPCGDGEDIYTSEARPLLRDEEIGPIKSVAHETRPSTPIRQLPVSPPGTPQKARLSQLCETPQAPVRNMSSALSWMMPLRFSKRATAVHDDVNCRLSYVSANLNSHDSIESWSETG